MPAKLPRILSPNLGCPIILAPEELKAEGLDIVVAEEEGPPVQMSVAACPSFPGEGEEFLLELVRAEELSQPTLPSSFTRLEETRFLISPVLRDRIFQGQARFFRYRAKVNGLPSDSLLRRCGQQYRPTLYDLHLKRGGEWVGAVHHALCLRPLNERLRFIHLTDLHIALRNDLYAADMRDDVSYPDLRQVSLNRFNNFNENLRRFIRYANDLADKGELDFVLVLGDLVDFLRHGFNEREDYGDNNYRVFQDLFLGTGQEKIRPIPNLGLKVPIFTSTGNHDWRFFPYDPVIQRKVYGVEKELAQQLSVNWADEQEEITRKVEAVYNSLISEGSPISNHTRLGWLINVGLRRLQKWQVQLMTPLTASVVAGFLSKIPAVGNYLAQFLGPYYPLLTSLIALALVPVAGSILLGVIRWFIRRMIMNLVAIEAGWPALKDYFLNINPFFNYAFRIGRNYFLILDTGHDCLRAQYLWDDGDKKLGPLSIRDNTIGGSPDTMAFYEANEYYPYSQISWIDRLMQLITREAKKADRPVRIFIGLHSPPANLSRKELRKAEQMAPAQASGVLLPEGRFDIRYGSINHYVSHFFHLCLGRIEQDPVSQHYLPVDIVLAGHSHWKLELRLAWEEKQNKPALYYGDFTREPERFQRSFDTLRPLLLQTPASGPREESAPSPPYFRRMEIDEKGNLLRADVLALQEEGKAIVPNFIS